MEVAQSGVGGELDDGCCAFGVCWGGGAMKGEVVKHLYSLLESEIAIAVWF